MKGISLAICLLLSFCTYAQDTSSFFEKVFQFPDKLFGAIDKRTSAYQQKLVGQTDKYLSKLAIREKKMQRKLLKKDSVAARQIFGNTDSIYGAMRQQVTDCDTSITLRNLSYDSHLDSIRTTLQFLERNYKPEFDVDRLGQLKAAAENCTQLQLKLNATNAIQKRIQQRQQFLQQQLGKIGWVEQLNGYRKEVYYYRQQLREYKEVFNDPAKGEKLLLQVLNQVPAFRKFFASHSQLASLFRLPGSTEELANVSGLQARNQLQQDLQQRLGNGTNTSQLMQQQLGQGNAQLNQIRNVVSKTGGNTENMPGFKPNSQKTKSFRKRFELGTNLQSVKPNGYFPATTDLGLSLGYKLNDKSIVGVGGSYKLGLGNSFRDIRISHQGMGLRSFIDIKLKGSIWISGGGEMNYRPSLTDTLSASSSGHGLEGARWQRSALLGISKKYQIGNKWKGNLQLFYDFLYHQQVPRTQPVVFRMGYNFK